MREEIANYVYPIINHGLKLKDTLARGEMADFDQQQATLKGLLLSEMEARRLPDGAGDSSIDNSLAGGNVRATRQGTEQFLGIRYALVCWLDEIMIDDSPWQEQWTDRKLETHLYESNDRGWKFWDQARRAEGRPGSDALEVFFLCVMLGFRGDYRDQPDRLRQWMQTVQNRIARTQGAEWPAPPAIEPPIHVPPLRARDHLQKVVLAGAVVLLFVMFMAAFWAVNYFGT